jgi:hypothetical protein
MNEKDLIKDLTTNAAAIIAYENNYGLAILLVEDLSKVLRAGTVVVFWQDGEITILPNRFTLIQLISWTI